MWARFLNRKGLMNAKDSSLILKKRAEGYSAVASGLPVITSRQNGVSELIKSGLEGGVIDDPACVNELLDRLQPMFDPSIRRRMGQAARQTALLHTMDCNCNRIEAVYEEILQSRRRGAA